MSLRIRVRAPNAPSSAAGLSTPALLLALFAAGSLTNQSAAADVPQGIVRSKHANTLYGSRFNAATSVPRPNVAMRRPDEVADRAKFHIKFAGNFPDEAKAAFRGAANIWSSLLTSRVTIDIEANWTSLGQSGPSEIVLASTSVWFWQSRHPPTPLKGNTWYPTALANKYLGRDVDPTSPDLHSDFNGDVKNWYFGTDGLTPLDQYDFLSVALHQIAHGLGFTGSMTVDAMGVGSFGMTAPGAQLYPLVFDTFVRAPDGSLTDGINYANPSPQLGTQLQANKVLFYGNATSRACGGGAALLYAPTPWRQGSSYVHLDEFAYPPGNVNSLMTPFIGWSETIHNPGPIVLAVLMDIGW